MAEVLPHWPGNREKSEARFSYPWDQWIDLDRNGHGDIWLAELGIDFPADSNVWNFRSALYTRTQVVTRSRKKKAPLVPKRVRIKATGQETVRRVPDFKTLRVKVRIVSDTQVAFQFYDSKEPPPEPEVIKVAVPTRRPMIRQRTAPKSRLRKVMATV